MNGREIESGTVLPSGIIVLENTQKKITRGKQKVCYAPIYKMRCTCGAIFEHTYSYNLKSCGDKKKHPRKQKERGSLESINHSGEILSSGVRIIRKLRAEKDEHTGRNFTVYLQKCPICGKEFEARFKPKRLSCGCYRDKINHSDERKQQFENNIGKYQAFGTNLAIVKSSRIPITNKSGYKGVCFYKGKWLAQMTFRGFDYYKKCNTKEEAIEERRKMEKERDIFLKWYDSLSEDEKEFFSEQYDNNKKEFSRFYKEKLKEILQ